MHVTLSHIEEMFFFLEIVFLLILPIYFVLNFNPSDTVINETTAFSD